MVAEARLITKANSTARKTPITEKVVLGNAEYSGDTIEYNACNPFDPRRYPNVEVCGAATQLKVFLRARCEGYYQYTEIIGQCDSTTSCKDVAVSSNHWLS